MERERCLFPSLAVPRLADPQCVSAKFQVSCDRYASGLFLRETDFFQNVGSELRASLYTSKCCYVRSVAGVGMGGGVGGEMFTQDAEYLKSRLWRNVQLDVQLLFYLRHCCW